MADPTGGPETAPALTIPAPAKINLYLHVTAKRDDGYHELDSLVVFAGVHDVVHVTPVPGGAVTLGIDGPYADGVPAGGDNLAVMAAESLRQMTGADAGVHIRLEKRLPVASGIGGGSADAAAVLRGLARLWDLDTGTDAFAGLALSLGADVPVCLAGRAAFVGGIGEVLEPAPGLPPAWLVLANPGRAVPTASVFAGLGENFSAADRFAEPSADAEALARKLAERRNDLSDSARALEPAIGDVLGALEAADNCLLARMSGSGATCFGLFDDAGAAARAAATVAQQHGDWWVRAAPLLADTETLTA